MTTHACKKCGSNRPVKFELPKEGLSEITVKRFCGYCSALIDSVYFDKVPHYAVSKRSIWSLTQSVDLINRAKAEIGFREDGQGTLKNISYWNLYSHLVKMAAQ